MLFKLIIKKNDSESEPFESEFEKEVVKIGRLPENDVCLNDRFVSRNQAEIRGDGKEFKIVATTSSSFTYLNDVQLINDQETRLSDGDQIRLPGFSISFVLSYRKPKEKESFEKPEPPPEKNKIDEMPSEEVERAGQTLALRLRNTFSGAVKEGRAERKKRLEDTVREFLLPYGDTGVSDTILLFASASFSSDTPETVVPKKKKRESSAFEAFESLAEAWSFKNPLSSDADVLEFSARVKSVMDIFIRNLFENVSMYREFQQEYDVEATRIYNWEKNPLKLAVSKESIKEYLFSQPKGGSGSILDHLDEVHRDIKLHQLGVLKGFKKSLKELLNEMSPAALASETGIGETDKNYRKIFEKLWTKDHTVLWKRYVEKYTDLCENETKTFNSIQKKFQAGYLSFLKKSKEL